MLISIQVLNIIFHYRHNCVSIESIRLVSCPWNSDQNSTQTLPGGGGGPGVGECMGRGLLRYRGWVGVVGIQG